MCVIIDACVRDLIFCAMPKPDAVPVIQWIESDQGRMVYGGNRLCNELFGSANARRRLRVWKQAGRALQYPDQLVDDEKSRIDQLGIAKSNDTHIVALARVSGARTIYTTDTALHDDFKNLSLVNNPGGRVYQNQKHRHLLEHTSSCRAGQARFDQMLWD
jgi:hypothetical protein